MEGKFRKLRITVTLETARQAANRHQEAVASGTHGTQLLLRRQHEEPGLRDTGILGADRGRQRPQAPGHD